MQSQTTRRGFLQYFKLHSHRIIPSSPVIPHNDPSLLFTNAGMNQFKDIFLGKEKRDYSRATTSQKCIRAGGKHNDLENVGHTSRHLTFFEMLGNFSFGDYFKKEAIDFAWDVSTHIFGFDPEKIWVSVYKEDDEAFALWEKHLSVKKIVRFGEKENFWQMGDTGPCGPCSELLFDRGESYGKATNPYEDPNGERYLEFWNLVFMQFSRDEKGILTPLPKPCIDTGAGLERVVSLQMGVDSVFLTDIFRSLIAQVENLSGKKYKEKDSKLAPAFHVIADHLRSLSFAIADGVQPSNTDRGYILRKILRRAVRYGKILGFHQPFLASVFPRLAQEMGDDFPELRLVQDRIQEILTLEEEQFLKTLHRGGNLLSLIIESAKKKKGEIPGDDIFKLKDTYGFPVEEIELIARDEHLTMDLERFHSLEEEARLKSKKTKKQEATSSFDPLLQSYLKDHPATLFVGYHQTQAVTSLSTILKQEEFVSQLSEGEEGALLLESTPFYVEKGGQVGDQGTIESGKSQFVVTHCTSPISGLILHHGIVKKGSFSAGEKVQARIDEKRRKEVARNHSATHLLHWALYQVLGEHIRQAGSLVDEKRLRFDFNHHKGVSSEEIFQVEKIVNELIRDNFPIQTVETLLEEVQKNQDIKQFFGEKYEASVRVVTMGPSQELCGGCHTSRTGDIGFFKIKTESSIAAGIRRIEAVTGEGAEEWIHEKDSLLQRASSLLKTNEGHLLSALNQLFESQRDLLAQVKLLREKDLDQLATSLHQQMERIGPIHFLAKEISLQPVECLPFLEKMIKNASSTVLILGCQEESRCHLYIKITPDLVSKGLSANELLQKVLPLIQGKGGGKKDFAQAGGTHPQGMAQAFDQLRTAIQEQC